MEEYVLSPDFITRISTLLEDYQNKKAIKLNKDSKEPYAVTRFFGATDSKTRFNQMCFITSVLSALRDSLPNRTTDDIPPDTLSSLRLLVVVCLFEKSRIDETYTLRSSKNAVLATLLDKALGITQKNPIDEQTKACCLLTAKRILNAENHFEKFNTRLHSEKLPQLNDKEWEAFREFVDSECKKLDPKLSWDSFPTAALLGQIGGYSSRVIGFSTGYVFGDMIAKSRPMLPAKYRLTTTVGSSILLLAGSISTTGTVFFLPAIVGQVLDTFCGISMAYVMGTVFKILGTGIGYGIGGSVDISVQLLKCAIRTIQHFHQEYDNKKSGIKLLDGTQYILGEKLEPCEVNDEMPEVYAMELILEGDNLVLKVGDLTYQYPIHNKELRTIMPLISQPITDIAVADDLTNPSEKTHAIYQSVDTL